MSDNTRKKRQAKKTKERTWNKRTYKQRQIIEKCKTSK